MPLCPYDAKILDGVAEALDHPDIDLSSGNITVDQEPAQHHLRRIATLIRWSPAWAAAAAWVGFMAGIGWHHR